MFWLGLVVFIMGCFIVAAMGGIHADLSDIADCLNELGKKSQTFVISQNGPKSRVYEVIGKDPSTNKLVVRLAADIELVDRNSVRDVQGPTR